MRYGLFLLVLISVVIPAHNAAGVIGAQLTALEGQLDADPFEVLVVDNLSTDNTRDEVEQFRERLDLHLLDAPETPSASHARNVGVQHARGEYVLFVDADDVASPSLIAAYRAEAHRFRIMGGAYDEARLNDPDIAEWRYQLTANGLPVAFQTIPFFLMGNAAIHRSVFHEIGGFDEALRHGGEEVDFSARAFLAGIEIGWVPEAVIYYRHRTSLKGLSLQFLDYGRATRYVYTRYRDRASLPPTRITGIARVTWDVLIHVVNLARGNQRRGEWIRIASFYAGMALEAVSEFRTSLRREPVEESAR